MLIKTDSAFEKFPSFFIRMNASNYNIFLFYILVLFFGFIKGRLPTVLLYFNTAGYFLCYLLRKQRKRI